ncbi:spermidine putrescine ABC transporter ATP-binding [Micractinium conductrix]|uniref:Spermidine putrescine ABC transporter ATP-binding n=1 Tax=Micractinium conductrix TaxID=554055 RepID=A0A2P6VQV7_9CHLO|nr:spermidine putrescine ABC transporter ATP-binding [Micractinium conductrix]|eukprot:PSC76445.1 spermidine putrescine ABC transporter ATP-binding [Micractinium conductrix]
MAVGGPIAFILGPVFYILTSVLSLGTFKVVYTALARLAYQKQGGPFGEYVQPTLRNHVQFLESIFGQPATFTPSVTHVLLVAIMLVLIVQLDGRRR